MPWRAHQSRGLPSPLIWLPPSTPPSLLPSRRYPLDPLFPLPSLHTSPHQPPASPMPSLAASPLWFARPPTNDPAICSCSAHGFYLPSQRKRGGKGEFRLPPPPENSPAACKLPTSRSLSLSPLPSGGSCGPRVRLSVGCWLRGRDGKTHHQEVPEAEQDLPLEHAHARADLHQQPSAASEAPGDKGKGRDEGRRRRDRTRQSGCGCKEEGGGGWGVQKGSMQGKGHVSRPRGRGQLRTRRRPRPPPRPAAGSRPEEPSTLRVGSPPRASRAASTS